MATSSPQQPNPSVRPKHPKPPHIVLDSDDDQDLIDQVEMDAASIQDDQVIDDHDMIERIHESSKRPRKMEGREAPKISNAEINQSIKSLESRIGRLEDGQNEIIRLIHQLLQSTPTFLSSGSSGALKATSKSGTVTIPRPPF